MLSSYIPVSSALVWTFILPRHFRCQKILIVGYLQVVSALHYLYSQLRVIHRDVKPSNILINRKGEVKMCDFGISGYLVDSVAKTIDAGCKPYMAVRNPVILSMKIVFPCLINTFSTVAFFCSQKG